MRILLTGASGLLGRYFFESNPDKAAFKITGTSLRDHPQDCFKGLDGYHPIPFEDRSAYKDLLDRLKPEVIVNAGSDGNVDSVQKNPDVGRYMNYEFPLFLLKEAVQRDALFVHFSSNAVYDGENAPYSEVSSQNPVNIYGELKKIADIEVMKSAGRRLLIRPIVAYGWNFSFGRKNPVTQFLPLMAEQKPLRVVTDQFENPVYAGDVARVLWKCITTGYCGDLNVAGGDQGINRYDWIKTVAEVFGIKSLPISPAKMADFGTMAPRPRDTRFDTSKLRRELDLDLLTVKDGTLIMKNDAGRSYFGGMTHGTAEK